jgi:uncharacterized membrane protein YeaQ/YmgE (transglycosylase-associated protein family)
MDPIVLLVAGLIAGWLAGLLMKRSGYGLIGDIGVVGAAAFVALARLLTRRTAQA